MRDAHGDNCIDLDEVCMSRSQSECLAQVNAPKLLFRHLLHLHSSGRPCLLTAFLQLVLLPLTICP